MEGLSWEVREQSDGVKIIFTGVIAESADFRPLFPQCHGDVVLDLAGITRVNSCGTREWMRFITTIESTSRSLTLERCSVIIVSQLNMIVSFIGSGTVRSAFAPYYCAECQVHQNILIDLTAAIPVDLEAARACPSCNGKLEFDDFPDRYFGFARAGG